MNDEPTLDMFDDPTLDMYDQGEEKGAVNDEPTLDMFDQDPSQTEQRVEGDVNTTTPPEDVSPYQRAGAPPEDFAEAGRKTKEFASNLMGSPDPDIGLADSIIGTALEAPVDLAYGAASWIPAQIARHGYVATKKLSDFEDWLFKEVTGAKRTSRAKMKPSELAEKGKAISTWIQTLGGVEHTNENGETEIIGGLAVPQTKTGERILSQVGAAIEPIQKIAEWSARGIDPEKHPNLHNLAATGVEFGLFATIPKVGKGLKSISAKRAKALELEGKARERAEKKVIEEQEKLLNEMEISAKKGEFDKIVSEYQAEVGPRVKEARANERQSLGMDRSAAEIANQEAIDNLGNNPPEQLPGRVAREAERFQEGLRPDRRSLSEQSQAGRGAEGDVRVPERTPQPEPVTPPERTFTDRTEPISELGVPRREFQIDPETGIEQTVDQTGRTVYKIEDGKMKTVEHVPGQRTVWQITMDPLRNERGQLNINFGRKKLKEKLTEVQRERIRKIGRSVEASGMSLDDFLKKQGMSDRKQREFKKLHDLIKQEKPFESALTKDKTPFNNDPLKLQSGDVNVNVIPSKRLNPAIKVGRKVINQLESAKRTVTPNFVKTFQPTWSGMKKFKIPLTKELWHKVNNIEKARLEDLTGVKEKIAELQEIYPKKKLREEAFVKMMSKDKLGRDAMEKLGIRPIDGKIEYEGLALELEPLFKEMLARINDTRVSIGKKKITRRDNYLPMIAQESFYDKIRTIFKGDDASIGRPNMVLDSLKDINYRHDFSTAEATNFRHIKRGKLRRGTKLDKDPLALYGKYGNTALRHIHYSPLNAFVEQLVRGKFTDSKGKNFELSKRNPELATFLSRWSNKLSGRPNVILPEGLRFLETGAQKISNNLTAATLGWSIRTVMVQLTAMLPVMSEFGIAPTMNGLLDTVAKSKSAPIEKSSVLAIRTADVFINDMVNFQLKGKIARTLLTPQNKALSAMKFVDSVIAEAAWRTAYKDASKSLGEQAAIRHADEVVVRTQGSGFAGDLSPIQMNAMGKAITLWQTFTINHINWIGKEILDIKNPERNPVETSRRVMTYLVGSALISTMFEDVMGIQSPQPAPIKAIQRGLEEGDTGAAAALKGLLELTEILPIGSSVKFGSDPAGAVFQFLGDISEGIGKDLPDAMNGDKKAMQRLAFLLAKGVGVAGSGQVRRYVKGKQRGESTTGALLGTYTPLKGKGSGRRSSKRPTRGSNRFNRPTR